MNPKTTAVLFAFASALAAFVYFWAIKGEPARQEAKAAEHRLFRDVVQAEIESISLRVADAREIRLERRAGHWRLAAPIEFAADAFAADGIAGAITQLTSQSVIDDPQPREVYGFGAQSAEIRFAVGGLEKILRIGNATPIGANSYASIDGDARVYTVANYQVQPFQKELDDLRDKRIIDFDSAAVKRIRVSWTGMQLVVERGADGWELVEPVQGSADADTVGDLLSSLGFLRASGFVDELMSDAETGLASPQFAIELEASPVSEGAQPVTARLAVGGVDDSGGQRFARGAAESLYTISQASLDDFPRSLIEYRDRRLAAFAVDDVRRVELGFHTEAGETVAVRVERAADGWTSDAEPIAGGKFDALVDALSSLRAADIIAEELGPEELQAMGLEPARAVLHVYGDGEPAERLAEIHLGVAFGNGITARTPDRHSVFLLDAALAEQLPSSLGDYRDRFVAQPESDPGAEEILDQGAGEG